MPSLRAFPGGTGPNGRVPAHQVTGNWDLLSHPLTLHPVDYSVGMGDRAQPLELPF